MAKGIDIESFFGGMSSTDKKRFGKIVENGNIKDGSELVDYISGLIDGKEGGFGGGRGKEDGFADLFSMRETNKEASRLLKVLKEIKENGTRDQNPEDLETLGKMGLNLNDMERSSKEVEKNLKNIKFDSNFANRLTEANRQIKGIGNSLSNMYDNMNRIVEPWAKANDAASKYAKTVAMGAAGMEAMTKRTINNVVNREIGINYNMSTDELIKAQQKYVEGVGRSLSIDNTQQESLAAMTAVMGERSTELAAAFENFGVNLNTTAERSGKMFDKASKTGISFEKLTDNVAKNIKIAQNYTFKNGLKGLESMAAKAVALRMDMAQVAALADKVSSVEGSIDVASKLQVLGGPFASMADPLGMLNEGLTDMEGLMDRVTKMVGGMGNFDKATGEVKVSAFNKKRVQAAAEAMGVSYDTLMESVNAQAKRSEVKRQISSSSTAKNLSKDMQELIMNSATFDENGKAVVSIKGDKKSIDKLEEGDYKELIKETQSESDDIKDIAKILRSHFDYTEGIEKQKDAVQAQMVGPIGKGIDKLIRLAGEQRWLLRVMAFSQVAGKFGDSLSSGIDIFRSFRGIRGRRGAKGLFNGGVESSVPSKIYGRGSKSMTGEGKVSEITEKSTGRTRKRTIEHGNKHFRESSEIPKMSKGTDKTGNALRKMKQAKNLIKDGKGLKVLSSVAKKAGGKIPVVGGLIGGGLTFMENKDAFKDRATRGSAIGKTAGATAGSVVGGALGTFLGPLGSIAGAAVGEWVGKHIGGFIGGIQDKRVAKNSAIVDNQLEKHGIQRKGDYKVSDLKKIDNALQSGKMSNKLRRKLLSEGDTDIVKQIDDRKTEIEKTKEPKGKGKSRDKKHASMENDAISKNMGIVHFNVEKAYFNGHAFGSVGGGFENRLGTKLPSIGMMALRQTSPFSRFSEHGENKGGLGRGERMIVSPLGIELSPVKRTLGGFPLKEAEKNNGGNEIHGNNGLGILVKVIPSLFGNKSNGINDMQTHGNMAGVGNIIETGKKKHDEPHKGFSESFLVKNAVVEKAQINALRENPKESDAMVKINKTNDSEKNNSRNRKSKGNIPYTNVDDSIKFGLKPFAMHYGGGLVNRIAAKLPNSGVLEQRRTSPFSRFSEHGENKGGLGRGERMIVSPLGIELSPVKRTLGGFPLKEAEKNNGGNEIHGNIGFGISGKVIPSLFGDKSNGINAMQTHENMAGIGNRIEAGKKKHDEPHKGFSESFFVKNAVVEKAQINALRENSKESDVTVKINKTNDSEKNNSRNRKSKWNIPYTNVDDSTKFGLKPFAMHYGGGFGNRIAAKLPGGNMLEQRRTSPFSRFVGYDGNKGGLENGKGRMANALGGISPTIQMSPVIFHMMEKEPNEIAKHENKRNDGNVKEKAKSRKRNDYRNALLQANIGSAIKGIIPFINPVIGAIVGSAFGWMKPNRNEKETLSFKRFSYGPLMEAFNSNGNKAEKQFDESENTISLGQYIKELIRRSDSFGKNMEVGVTINGKFNPNNELDKTDYDTLIKEGKKTGGRPEIKAKPEKGESVEAKEMHKKAEVKASNEKKRDEERRKAESEQRKRSFNGGKIDVNITGTIRLEANGKQFNMDELMKDSGFKQELAKLISEQIKYNSTQSNVVGRK